MQEHEKWLLIAFEDLRAAKVLLKVELFSSATYHCQQASEKAMKAYLSYNKNEISKTHDLIRLLELCKQFDLNFEKVYHNAEFLNPFATKFRYPTEFDIPDLVDSKYALKCAESIVEFVKKKLTKPDTGQNKITFERKKSSS